MTIIFYSFVSVIYDVCVRHCLHNFLYLQVSVTIVVWE